MKFEQRQRTGTRQKDASKRILTHLTMNSGHSMVSPRHKHSEFEMSMIERHLREGSDIPSPAHPGFGTSIETLAGGWMFTIHLRTEPVVTCFVCKGGDELAPLRIWSRSILLWEEVKTTIPFSWPFPAPMQPSSAPWMVAVLHYPYFTKKIDLKVPTLAVYEQLVAWNLMEG